MNWAEATKELNKGRKIKRKAWRHLTIKRDCGYLKISNNERSSVLLEAETYAADDWELVIERMIFREAVSDLEDGCAVRRESWNDSILDIRKAANGDKLEQRIVDANGIVRVYPYVPVLEDLSAVDWVRTYDEVPMNWAGAVELLKAGKRVKRLSSNWILSLKNDGTTLVRNDSQREECHGFTDLVFWSEIQATDWIEVKDERIEDAELPQSEEQT